MERIFESRLVNEVSTQLLVFKSPGREGIFLILPEVHPGPFSAIGGSNLPYRLFNFFQKRAIIFHSISDHSLNLPSSSEVEKYLETMKFSELKNDDEYCSPRSKSTLQNSPLQGLHSLHLPFYLCRKILEWKICHFLSNHY